MASNHAKTVGSLGSFIGSLKDSIEPLLSPSSTIQQPHIYIGNEAGDADSLISALCYGFLEYSKQQDETTVHLPLLSIPRGELTLRPEVRTLFSLTTLKDMSDLENSLCYFDDFPQDNQENSSTLLHILTSKHNVQTTLLDHNVLAPKLTKMYPLLENGIVSIIDHHLDQGLYHNSVQDVHRKIAFSHDVALAGSACTLVAEAFLQHDKMATHNLLNKDIATLLAGVILIDTLNMDVAAKKGTDRDAAILEALLPLVDTSRDELFQMLMNAKFNPVWWASLTSAQILGYDYKQGEVNGGVNYGMSSALVSLTSLLGQPDFTEVCLNFMTSKQLAAFSVMSMTTTTNDDGGGGDGPTKHRELMIVALSPHKLEQIQNAFFSIASGLDLIPLNIKVNDTSSEKSQCYIATFTQQDISKSRKQVMPMFHQAIQLAFENQACSE